MNVRTWVRNGHTSDLDAAARLLVRARGMELSAAHLVAGALMASGRMFVVEAGRHEVAGLAHVTFHVDHGVLDYLVVDSSFVGFGLPGRLIGFAQAYCEYRGCPRLEVAAS